MVEDSYFPLFRRDFEGRLLLYRWDNEAGIIYTVWFDYTRQRFLDLREGDLIVAESYEKSESGYKVYNVLKITSIMPYHYALPQDIHRNYPGFLQEAVQSLASDWVDQDEEVKEETTKIICEAVSTNIQFEDATFSSQNEFLLSLQPQSTMSMVGSEVKVLTSKAVEAVFNKGLPAEISKIEVGRLLHKDDISIYLDLSRLLRYHFGIFGFTGAGKSNLVSFLIRRIMESEKEKYKIILFDLMEEYLGILVDLFEKEDFDSWILCESENTMPSALLDYLRKLQRGNDDAVLLEKATIALSNRILLPNSVIKTFEELRVEFVHRVPKPIFESIKRIIRRGKIKFLDRAGKLLSEIVGQWIDQVKKGKITDTHLFEELRREIIQHNEPMTEETCKNWIYAISRALKEENSFTSGNYRGVDKSTYRVLEKFAKSSSRKKDLITIKQNFEDYLSKLIEKKSKPTPNPVSIDEIEVLFNDNKKNTFILVLSNNENNLRELAFELGYRIYNHRRRQGINSPQVAFIFDEADEFIPSDTKNDSQKRSIQVITDLARRGRKFGLGVGIATQRATYLQTGIMGQLHTYFISKLPRATDRSRVAEAFALTDAEFVQTLKFTQGNWLIVSHNATGLPGVAIPITVPNSEEELIENTMKH